MKFTEFLRKHMVLWALLTGFILGALSRECSHEVLDTSDRIDPVSQPEAPVSHDSCMANPTLCAMPVEVQQQVLRDQFTRQFHEYRLEKLQECVDDPGCELCCGYLEEYEKLKEELQ